MASIKTKFTVGMFVITGLGVAVISLIWLGMSNYFEKGKKYTAYFDESVQGLDIDSPVKYRGVSIGRVQDVGVAPDSRLIEVVLIIEADMTLESDMVAQLKSVGITGIMFIEIDRKKKGEPDYMPAISFETKYPVVATKSSGMKMFMDGMSDLRDLISKLDAKGMSEKIKKVLDKLNKTLDSADNAVSGIDRLITSNEKELNLSLARLKGTIENADIFIKEAVILVKKSGPGISGMQRHLLATLQNLEKASENLNAFVDIISEQPSQLVFGQPPPSRKVGPDR